LKVNEDDKERGFCVNIAEQYLNSSKSQQSCTKNKKDVLINKKSRF